MLLYRVPCTDNQLCIETDIKAGLFSGLLIHLGPGKLRRFIRGIPANHNLPISPHFTAKMFDLLQPILVLLKSGRELVFLSFSQLVDGLQRQLLCSIQLV